MKKRIGIVGVQLWNMRIKGNLQRIWRKKGIAYM